jgi:hypothetical protein
MDIHFGVEWFNKVPNFGVMGTGIRGVQNTEKYGSVQQEMDALYGPFSKSSTHARGEKVVQHKLRSRGLAQRNGGKLPPAVLNINFNDLATIVNGRPKDVARDRPFDFNFTKEKILWLWAKVGFVPFTRNCLNNKSEEGIRTAKQRKGTQELRVKV